MYLKIVRLEATEDGMRGQLLINGRLFANTLERPWENNEVNISCIPEGIYQGKKYNSKRHGKTLQIMSVVNRTYILFHTGNTMEDSQGCILLGETFSKSGCAVHSSASAMARFKEVLVQSTQFTVEVCNKF